MNCFLPNNNKIQRRFHFNRVQKRSNKILVVEIVQDHLILWYYDVRLYHLSVMVWYVAYKFKSDVFSTLSSVDFRMN